jgi:tRNA (adenine57-N1/adenine58-N1)-methyltransferase
VTLQLRDVCKDGFGMEAVADAVFLDLPMPWEAITAAKAAIKLSGGRLASFSPCIEQVQRTCQQLRDLCFHDIEVVETLRRQMCVGERTLCVATPDGPTPHKLTRPTLSNVTLYTAQPAKNIPGHTGFLTFATLPPRSPPPSARQQETAISSETDIVQKP